MLFMVLFVLTELLLLQKLINEPPLTEKAGGKYYPDWKSNIGSPIYAFIMIFFVAIVATEWLLRRWWGLV